MRTILHEKIYLVFILSCLLPSFVVAQQPSTPTLQELQNLFEEERPNPIFLHVSAELLWQAANGSLPFDVEDYCALEDNAGIMKYGPQTKEKEFAIEALAGDLITWTGKVDRFSRNKYDISIKQIVVTEIIGENIFTTSYLPGANKKVSAKVKESFNKLPAEVRYNIMFELSLKNSDSTKLFTLDPWVFVK